MTSVWKLRWELQNHVAGIVWAPQDLFRCKSKLARRLDREDRFTGDIERSSLRCPRNQDCNRRCSKSVQWMPHNGSRISGEPLPKSFDEDTQFAAKPHEPPASKALVPQA